MTSESLFTRERNYKAIFICLIVLNIALLTLGVVPNALSDVYLSDAFFEIGFVICFVLIYKVFKDWNAVKKEITKRNL